jgi:hypothetical protein
MNPDGGEGAPGRALVALGLALATVACSGPTAPTDMLPGGETIVLANGSALVLRDTGELDPWRGAIEQGVRQALALASPLIPVSRVRIEVSAGLAGVIPELGFGGRADPETVRLVFQPSSLLDDTIGTDLMPLVAHELHHVARLRSVGFPENLLAAMVLEGLADRFSVEVAGVDPPLWSSALSAAEIEIWLARAREIWLSGSYDFDAWFFGTTSEIPRWTGYTLGFEIVGRYLETNPGRLPSSLVSEPARSFAPPAG